VAVVHVKVIYSQEELLLSLSLPLSFPLSAQLNSHRNSFPEEERENYLPQLYIDLHSWTFRDQFGMNSLKFSYFTTNLRIFELSCVTGIPCIFSAFDIFKLFKSYSFITSEIYFTITPGRLHRKLSFYYSLI